MTGYKFNIDPKQLSEEQLAKHKDFGKVMQNYQRMTHPLYKTPLYRYRRIFFALLVVGVVSWIVIEFGNEKNERKKTSGDSVQNDTQHIMIPYKPHLETLRPFIDEKKNNPGGAK